MDEKNVCVIKDSTHDKQEGVYENYTGKDDWMAQTIERMDKDGWDYWKRIPDLGLTIFRKKLV